MKHDFANMIVIIDGRVAGVSGDKYLGALIDLGGSKASLDKVAKIVQNWLPGTRKVQVYVESVERGEVAAKLVSVRSEEEVEQRKGGIVKASVQQCSKMLRLSEWATGFAASTIDTLLDAESHVHGHSTKEVELHELGSADTLVDVLGVAYLADKLGLGGLEWWSTSLSVGSGTSHFSGRDYSNPPPAVAEILRAHKVPMSPGKVEQELTTPTGAAITVNLTKNVSDSYPTIRPGKIGYGAGSREIKEVANVLRIITGERVDPSHSHDQVVVLETNLDDVTGEVIGHAIERVMEVGARDVTVTPVYMKKNRPGHMFSVIVDAGRSEELARVIMEETGSLGVREIPVRRHITLRTTGKRVLQVKGNQYPLKVKSVVDAEGRILREKVEYEDRKRMAHKTGMSIGEIDRLVRKDKSSR